MAPQLTATGQTLGTLEYMSPEQLMGKPLDGRSDIYGLGVLAFELITGRLPFPDAVGPAALISAQLKKVPPSPSSAHPEGNIPAEVDQLILKMLEKDKNNRFRDATELRREIDGILSTLASGMRQERSSPNLAIPTPPPGMVQPHNVGTGPLHLPQQAVQHAYGAGQPYHAGPVMRAGGTPLSNQVPTPPPHHHHGGGQVMAPHQGSGTEPVRMVKPSSNAGLWILIAVLAVLAIGGAVVGYLAMK
jgi:serine/threonine protein kinase